jgi:pyruvate dehydrogenase E1 component
LHPGQEQRVPLVRRLLADSSGPIVAVTDFMKIVPEQVARFLPDRHFVPLGTDGMGRSDTREALRRFFEVDAGHVVVAVLSALAELGEVKTEVVADAIARYGIDPEAVNPVAV